MFSYILFCQNPFDPKSVDPDYEEEFIAVKKAGLGILFFDFDEFVAGNIGKSLAKVQNTGQIKKVIYRGWMLTPGQYSQLYTNLFGKGMHLINSPQQYQNCHYLPDSLQFIEGLTPKTVFEKLDETKSISAILEKSKSFGNKSIIIKDYVKSEKHHWETACFVQDASDIEKIKSTITAFLGLRGNQLNEGIVLREFVDLTHLATHSKSGMPLTEEYRLFFLNNKLIGMYDYWGEGMYTAEKPDTTKFEEIAKKVNSHFFTMDIARQKNGEFIIIELGDAQVSGLPDNASKNEFLKAIGNTH